MPLILTIGAGLVAGPLPQAFKAAAFQSLAHAAQFGHLRCPGQGWLVRHSGRRRRGVVFVCQESGVDGLPVALAFKAFGKLLPPLR
jgi:hypothetical protein